MDRVCQNQDVDDRLNDRDESTPKLVFEPTFLSNPGALAVAVIGLVFLAAVLAAVIILAIGLFEF